MKKFIISIFNLREKYLYLLIVLSFFIIALYHLKSGYYMSSDSRTFSGLADNLIEFNFNIFDFSVRVPTFFITVPVSLIAICKIIFIDKWQYAFLFLNLIFLFFSMIFFAKTLLLVKVRSFLIFISLFLILASVDVLTWPRYILSDMNYTFLVILITYFITKGFVENKFNYLLIFSILFLILITRPSSISVIFAIILFIIISKHAFFLKPKSLLTSLLMLFILVPLVFGILYYLIEFNFSESTQLDWWLLSKVKIGMIIHDRPETWVNAPNTYKDVVNIYFLRLVNFFNPYAVSFSIIHNFLNIIQILLIFLSMCIWSLFGGNIRNQDKLFFFILLLSFSVASFHTFTLIDYDWRYRFPIVLPLIMLFPISIEMILKKYKY